MEVSDLLHMKNFQYKARNLRIDNIGEKND
jgi:hypothetical protein